MSRKPVTGRGSQNDANFTKKCWRVPYKIIVLLREGQYASSIARILKIPRTTIDYNVRKLHSIGFVKLEVQDGAKFYTLTKRGREFIRDHRCQLSRYGGELGKNRLHRLNIKFPILVDNPGAVFDKEHDMNNWIQKYTKLHFPIGITLQKNPKSVLAMFHQFETEQNKTFTDFFNHVMRGVYYVHHLLGERYGIKTDILGLEVTDQHIANERPDLKGKLDDKKRTTINLRRKASSYFPAGFEAKAWLDYSKDMPEIETNDLLYEERLLMMPETVQVINDKFVPMIKALTAQMSLHLEVKKETLDVLQEMKGYFKRENKKKR